MKSLKIITVIVFTLGLLSCEKTNVTPVLTGTWVEVTEKTDTISFDIPGAGAGVRVFILSRGFEKKNENLEPKTYSGMYNYQINGDSITLSDMQVCSIYFKNYYFELFESDTFNIGNFYNQRFNAHEILTFSKIK